MFKFLKKIIAKLLLIIAIIALIVSAFLTGGSTIAIFGVAFTSSMLVGLAISLVLLAYLVDPDEVNKFITNVGNGFGRIMSSVGEGIGKGIGGLLDGLGFGNFILLAGGALLGYKLLSKSNDREQKTSTIVLAKDNSELAADNIRKSDELLQLKRKLEEKGEVDNV